MKNFYNRAKRGWEYLSLRQIKRVMVAIIGGTVLMIGIALLVLPGPAFVVIPCGLAILATEFVWAKRWLEKARSLLSQAKGKVGGSRPRGSDPHLDPKR